MTWFNTEGQIIGSNPSALWTFQSTITGASQDISDLETGISESRQEAEQLVQLREGVIVGALNPAKEAMDRYIRARTKYLEQYESNNGAYTYKNNIDHGNSMNMSNPERYGAHIGARGGAEHVERYNTLPSITSWKIEQWAVVKNEYEADKEGWDDSASTINSRIVQVRQNFPDLLTNVDFAGLKLSADDYDFSVGWIHHSPETDSNGNKIVPGSPDDSSYGINFQEEQLYKTGTELQDILNHYGTRKSMAERYV